MTYKFTNSSSKVIEMANNIAKEMGHNYVGTEHILYGLAKEENGVASKVLHNQDITSEEIAKKIEELIGKEGPIDEVIDFTPRTKKVLENSFIEARKLGYSFIGTEHILIGLLRENECIASKILSDFNINLAKLYNEIIKVIQEGEKITGSKNVKKDDESYGEVRPKVIKKRGSYNKTPILNQFGEDLTIKAEDGKIDPIIGRKEEIEKVIQILSRRTKNNPCLIGEPGVGKTAIIEGLAQKIVDEEVPEILKGKRVVSIDISGMVAGAKYRGDFEERIKKALNEVKKVGDIILFIDEIHTIVGAGAAEGAIDAANILKPLLARGEIQLVGATTINEYRKYIEKDIALERRFNQIKVEEPTQKDTIKILKGIRDKYEAHHNVKITDEAIDAAVFLSVRYINDRFLPDKAIDLIDEASSRARLKSYIEPEKLKNMQEQLEEIKRNKEEAVLNQKFEKAAKLRDRENELKEKFEIEEDKWENKNSKSVTSITDENIAEVIASTTGIPVKKITQDENKKLKNLEIELHKRVIGQNEAVEAVSKAIRRGRVGLKDPNRPIGSFLFLGPTGVGKTELAKALAESLFDDEHNIVRIDMSEYMEKYSVSRLIGAPPGYVGYEEGGQLTEAVRRKPYSVVLFDEIEKAHPDVFNILLQVLDDGRITDSQGRTVDFKNTIIILTSNLGSDYILEGIGENGEISKEAQDKVNTLLKQSFRPEFLNRLDEIVFYKPLKKAEISKILDLLIIDLEKRLEDKHIHLELTDSAKNYLIDNGYDEIYGARPLKRFVQRKLETLIAKKILTQEILPNSTVTVDCKNDELYLAK